MIFVTVGTHEQQFNRLIETVDKLKEEGILSEEVIVQTGFSTYEPKFCQGHKLLEYREMVRLVSEARIVITHGGPSSFIMPLQIGKIPIVVPRQKRYQEHVNDHQLEFAKAVEERQGNIIVVEEMNELRETILNYESLIEAMPVEMKSNNKYFNEQLECIVNEMFKDEK